MERSVPTKLQEKNEAPPHPDDNRSKRNVNMRSTFGHEDTDMLSYDPIHPSNDELSADEATQVAQPQDTEMVSTNPSGQSAPLFKDMLLSCASKQKEEDEDLMLKGEDVIIDKFGPFLSISFSAIIHKLLTESMKFAVVIKMLGRNIRYIDLHDRVVSLWKLTETVQLSNLEGNCFTAKLSNKKDN